MRRLYIITFIAALLFTVSIPAQSGMNLVYEPAGGFSYQMPSDWTLGKIQGMDFQMIRLKKPGFSPNINFYQESNVYTFEKYFKVNLEDMKANTPNFVVVENSDFTTDTKVKGKKLVCSNTQGGQNLIQVYYFLDRKNRQKAIITCTSLLSEKDKFLPIFESVAKSFKTNK